MGNGFNVETYQLTKQEGSGTGGVSQDVLDRIAMLEANQMNIYGSFTYDFQSEKYTDLYKSTTLKVSNGIIPRQHINSIYLGIDNDDIVDYDNSDGIKWINGSITLDNTSNLSGIFTSFPINLNKAIGAKFNFDYTNKITTSGTDTKELVQKNLWFISATDKLGRLWMISSEQFSTGATNKAHVVIYNTDNTIYKSFDLANSVLFGQVDTTAAYPIFGASAMKFTEENVAVIVTRTHVATRNGGNVEWVDVSSFIDKVVLLNEAAQYNVLGAYTGYYNNNGGLWSYSGSSPADIKINANMLFVFFGSYSAMMDSNNGYLDSRYRNIAAYKINGSLATSLTNIELIKQLFRSTFPRTAGNEPGNYKYTAFRNSNFVYKPDGKDFYYTFGQSKDYVFDSNYINQIYSLQLGINTVDKVFNSEASLTDLNCVPLNALTNKIVIYNHPGFNGMFYASNGKLYVFGNDITTKAVLLNCYLPDWTSRTTGKLTVNNTISKTLNLQTCSFNIPAVAGYMPLSSYPNRNTFNNYMKIIEFDNKIHLFYMAPVSDTVRRLCLKYMAFDYDLNQVIEETILWQQSSDTVRFNDFNINVFNNDILVTCSIGNPNDFTVANTASKIYSIRISKVSSSITFQYLDNVEKTWRNVSDGQQVSFIGAVDNITLRATLTSQTYNSSLALKSVSIETWDNSGETSRQSEYYSTQIESVQNDGKGVLTANYELNGGAINWYISFDGGANYVATNLEEEFVYNQLEAPDFRIKAVMSVTDDAVVVPIIHSYTLKTSHVVLHSDLEEVQINLMKTNFKIDTYTNASKNGLLKMTIDTLSNSDSIDAANSSYTYYNPTGSAGGNYIQTNAELVSGGIKTLLLTTEEKLDATQTDSKILYYVSIDGGVTFKSIIPNVKLQISNTNSTADNLVMKAVFYNGAQLTSWGWAWN